MTFWKLKFGERELICKVFEILNELIMFEEYLPSGTIPLSTVNTYSGSEILQRHSLTTIIFLHEIYPCSLTFYLQDMMIGFWPESVIPINQEQFVVSKILLLIKELNRKIKKGMVRGKKTGKVNLRMDAEDFQFLFYDFIFESDKNYTSSFMQVFAPPKDSTVASVKTFLSYYGFSPIKSQEMFNNYIINGEDIVLKLGSYSTLHADLKRKKEANSYFNPLYNNLCLKKYSSESLKSQSLKLNFTQILQLEERIGIFRVKKLKNGHSIYIEKKRETDPAYIEENPYFKLNYCSSNSKFSISFNFKTRNMAGILI
jgi:hypothetical protein